jgi:hypothetical protein
MGYGILRVRPGAGSVIFARANAGSSTIGVHRPRCHIGLVFPSSATSARNVSARLRLIPPVPAPYQIQSICARDMVSPSHIYVLVNLTHGQSLPWHGAPPGLEKPKRQTIARVASIISRHVGSVGEKWPDWTGTGGAIDRNEAQLIGICT